MRNSEQPDANEVEETLAPLDANEITTPGTGFPIVGMGASAGGLEAFSTFFNHMPPDSGMAFVLAMHLSPEHESHAAELIARHTQMPVYPAEDGMRVEQNHVYVIQPNTTLTIWNGVLHVTESTFPRGPRYPIDEFFSALAEAQGRNAVCIVLSGTGWDGTKGLKAIKERGGMAMTQVGARYRSMPCSAHATGLGDYELTVEEMPARLLEYAAHLGQTDNQQVVDDLHKNSRRQLARILTMLRVHTGHDFSDYKETTVIRRVKRRMQVTQCSSPEQYLEHLRAAPPELSYLFNDMLINVTQFMRDADVFQTLAEKTLPEICAANGQRERVRVWVAGCATGEEAYSLGILFLDEISRGERNVRLQVFATDINEKALVIARGGIYPETITDHLSAAQLDRHFRKRDQGYEVLKALREACIFSKHDLIKDPPFSRMDMISCRNVLIYMTPTLQKRLIPEFHYVLRPGGVLLLGPSETISGFEDLFEPIDRRHRIFRRRETVTPRLDVPVSRGARLLSEEERESAPRPTEAEISRQVERYMLDQYAPPYVIVNDHFEIAYFSGRTGQYLEPPAGASDRNILNMARHGLRLHLRAALEEAIRDKTTVTRDEIQVKINGDYRTIRLTVQPVSQHGDATGYYAVIFEPIPPRSAKQAAQTPEPLSEAEEHALVQQLEEELRTTRRHLQTTIADLEASNKELKSANEELMSMNEERQSTAEELDASKEELQSVNEELTFANEELHRSNEELARANSDIKNLLDNIQIAMMFLDKHLHLRSITPRMSGLYHLRPSDTGHSILDIRPKHDYGDLEIDVASVLKALTPVERNVRTQEGEYIMRILPYHTLDGRIDGVVVTFFDVTNLAKARAEIEQLVEARAHRASELETMLALLPVGVLICTNPEGRQVRTNKLGAAILGVAEGLDLSGHEQPIPFKLMRDGEALARQNLPLQRVLMTGEAIQDEALSVARADGSTRDIQISIWPVRDKKGKISGAVGVFSDVTERKRQFDVWKAQQSALAELGLFALGEDDIAMVQRRVLECLYTVLDAALCEVWQLDAAGDQLSLVARAGGTSKDPGVHTVAANAGNLVGYTLASNEPVVVVDAVAETRFTYPAHLRSQGMVRSMSAAVRQDDSLWGVLAVHDDGQRQFLPHDTNFLQSVACLLGSVLKRKALEVGHGQDQRRRALAEAEDRMRQAERLASLGTLAAGIAHEVNNPLNAILMSAEMGLILLQNEKERERLPQLLQTIVKEAQRGGTITRNVLQFSKADHYTPKGRANFNDVIERAREHVASVLHKRNVRLDLELDATLPQLELNQIAMEQAMTNLISNAAQSGPSRVVIRTEREDEQVRITISDDGSGIPQEDIQHVFDPFYTTRRSQGGSGLGLSLVHRIVSDHDGTVEAHSAPGEGTQFIVRLPLALDDEQKSSRVKSPPRKDKQ